MSDQVITWPAPAGEIASPDFELVVQSTPIFVYAARVREQIDEAKDSIWTHKPDCPADIASFAIFDFAGKVEVIITPKHQFATASIHPISAGITPKVAKGVIRFTMDRPRPLTLMLDGSDDVVLHLFARMPEINAPKQGDPNVIYFGPGYHDITTLTVASDQTLYLAGGAVLRAALDPKEEGTLSPRTKLRAYKGAVIGVNNAVNVRVLGRGIIDARALPHPARPTLVSAGSRNIRFEGITIRHSCNWQVISRNSQDVVIENLCVIGGRLNTDGINTVCSHNVQIRNCFVRAHDDALAVKTTQPNMPATDILIENCVVWNDWGYALGVTYETRSPISHVVFRNCDILCVRHWALGVHVVDSATIREITFENIRIEDAARAARRWKHPAKLLRVGITKDMWGTDKEAGHIDGVKFYKVSLDGETPMRSEVLGHSAENKVENVSIVGLKYLGKNVTKPEEMNLKTNEFVSGVTFSSTQ